HKYQSRLFEGAIEGNAYRIPRESLRRVIPRPATKCTTLFWRHVVDPLECGRKVRDDVHGLNNDGTALKFASQFIDGPDIRNDEWNAGSQILGEFARERVLGTHERWPSNGKYVRACDRLRCGLV